MFILFSTLIWFELKRKIKFTLAFAYELLEPRKITKKGLMNTNCLVDKRPKNLHLSNNTLQKNTLCVFHGLPVKRAISC